MNFQPYSWTSFQSNWKFISQRSLWDSEPHALPCWAHGSLVSVAGGVLCTERSPTWEKALQGTSPTRERPYKYCNCGKTFTYYLVFSHMAWPKLHREGRDCGNGFDYSCSLTHTMGVTAERSPTSTGNGERPLPNTLLLSGVIKRPTLEKKTSECK